MGAELGGPCFKKDNMEISSIPPGFESPIRFSLKRTEVNQVINRSSPANASKTQNIELETLYDISETSRSLFHWSWTKYNELDNCSSNPIEFEQDMSRNELPKGVIRGCEACSNCQKVTAKWHPEESRRPDLEEAPVFYPTEEEFEDTLKYISSIRSKAEMYGICRIVPPPSWKPPCPLKEKNIWEMSKFTTRTQRIDKLQNRYSKRKRLQVNHDKRTKKKICRRSEVDHGNGTQEMKTLGEDGLSNAERFGFEAGLDFTLDAFQKYDDDFKAQYFRKLNNSSTSGGNKIIAEEQWQPTVEDIEGEYWRIVEKPTEVIEVLYGADLDTGAFGSGFPKKSQQVASASDIDYINSGWNLNNFPRLPGSVLSFESSDISGVVVPWLYIGMCFSSFCWHVEDHHMYSLNYMHWGAPKMWYGVPGSDAINLETAMRKHLPDLFEEQPDLLHQLVTQLSPSILRSEGVPVYRCIQNSGEFVLTFPRAYHAGFNCGFNCAEAVNIAPVDWLPHGQDAMELYREQGRRTSISHDKLLLSTAREAVKAYWEYNFQKKNTSKNLRWREVCGKDGILSKTLKTRVEAEQAWRESYQKSPVLKMESSFDADTERECCVCLFDLHLSAVGCHNCSPNKYACLKHAKLLCSCSWGSKFLLFRYDIGELNLLVEALEGRLSAVYQWARFDVGLALSSSAPRDNMQICTSQGSASKKISPITEERKEQVHEASLDLTKHIDNVNSSRIVRAPVVVLALECVKPSKCNSKKVKSAKLRRKKENSLQLPPQHKIQSCQASQFDSLKATLEALDKAEVDKSEHKDIIILSDEEEDEPSKNLCVVKGTSQNSVSPDNMTNLGGCTNRSASTTTLTAPVHVSSSHIEVEDHAEAESYIGANPPCSSYINFSSTDLDSNKDVPMNKETRDHDKANAECPRQQQTDDGISKGEDGHKKLRLDVELSSKDNILSVSSPSGHQNNLDGCYSQKGPRIAKVVRRTNCNVQPLVFGCVRAGKLWCDSRAIYPMGFRSRVRYIDVVDPTNMCHYLSEILDAGLEGPLFMVSVEHSPSEVFIHISASRCWELVRERVNQEIIKQRKLGKKKLPPVQPPGSLDGTEMFGFSSPAIMQVIQSMDRNHICKEYWQSRAVLQTGEQSQPVDSSTNFTVEPLAWKNDSRVEKILSGLFEKANTEELHTLYSLMNNENLDDKQSLLRRLLMREINKHSGQVYGLRDIGDQFILDL